MLVIAMSCFRLIVATLRTSLKARISLGPTFLLILALGTIPTPLLADPEFKMSIVVNQETTWGGAAERFADAIKYRTQGRIQIKNYFNGQLFAGKQTTEFALLQQGAADFAIGSVFNWASQVKELNLFGLPFMFPSYTALDAVEAGEPGTRLFKLIEQQGVVPIAWGENGFREVTNSKHSIRRPEDLHGLKIRVPPIPILVEIFQALGANPMTMNFDQALIVPARYSGRTGESDRAHCSIQTLGSAQVRHSMGLRDRPADPRGQCQDLGESEVVKIKTRCGTLVR